MSANDGKPKKENAQTIETSVRPEVTRLNNPDLISSNERVRIEVIYDSAVQKVKV